MSKKANEKELSGHAPSITKQAYKDSLHKPQVELVKLERLIQPNPQIVFGFDASNLENGQLAKQPRM